MPLPLLFYGFPLSFLKIILKSIWAFTKQVIPITFYTTEQNDFPIHILSQSLYSPF